MYILIITNRASNIIEDLETLKLLSKVVPDAIGSSNNLTEEKISEKCFELLFSFDEVITTGGYREPITLQQIRTNLEMESHEEKLHNMIKLSKMESAKDQARDAAKSIRDKQRDQARAGGSAMQGIGSSSGSSTDPTQSSTPDSSRAEISSIQSSSSTSLSSMTAKTSSSSKSSAPNVKGMSLSVAASKNKSLEDALVKEDKLAPVAKSSLSKAGASSSSNDNSSSSVSVVNHPVMLTIAERVSAKISRDGVIDSFEVKGALSLTAMTEEAATCSVHLSQLNTEAFAFSTHPKINKALYDKTKVVQLKDTTKGFPTVRPVGILKWTLNSNGNDNMIPIKINCWPEEESRGQMNVSIEYNVDSSCAIDLHDVKIKIPLGTSESVHVVSIDGNYKHSSLNNELVWEIDLIDQSNSTGSLEFNIAQKRTDAFFPISVHFNANQLFCPTDVTGVFTAANNKPIQYGLEKGMQSEDYIIGQN